MPDKEGKRSGAAGGRITASKRNLRLTKKPVLLLMPVSEFAAFALLHALITISKACFWLKSIKVVKIDGLLIG